MTNGEKYLKDTSYINCLNIASDIAHFMSCYFLNDVKKIDEHVAKGMIYDFFRINLKPTLTDDERVILRNMKCYNENIKTIERDMQGNLLVSNRHFAKFISIYNHLFQFIKERRRI